MKHNEYKKLVQLALYSELNNDEQKELENHLKSCEECRKEMEMQKNLLNVISETEKKEIDDTLLHEARVQLRGALRMESGKQTFGFQFFLNLFEFFIPPYRMAIAGVTTLLIGFFIGYIFIKPSPEIRYITKNADGTENVFSQQDVKISNISFIDSDASDGEVEFEFDAVKPMHFKGRVDDPNVQSVLTYAMLNEQNPGSRLNSINAMVSENTSSFDPEIKKALITVAITDKNPGVKREALNLLKRLPYDEDIKQAYLYVLSSDTSSALRITAIKALIETVQSGQKLSPKDLKIFKEKSKDENNNYIRYLTKTILQEHD
jgi:Putative zinc-finger